MDLPHHILASRALVMIPNSPFTSQLCPDPHTHLPPGKLLSDAPKTPPRLFLSGCPSSHLAHHPSASQARNLRVASFVLLPPLSFRLLSSTDSASPKPLDSPLYPIPITSALIWVLSSLTGPPHLCPHYVHTMSTSMSTPYLCWCEAQIHAVHTGPTSNCPGMSPGLQPAPCSQQAVPQR